MTFSVFGCSESSDSDGKKKPARTQGYWRVQASYEVIASGERIDFDYVVSLFNRDFPGSVNLSYLPQLMVKATKNGAAIAIDPPTYYRRHGFDIPPRRTPMKSVPLTMWYPDVNDLSFGIAYVTSDAYRSPNAKIRFLDFKVTRTDVEAFNAWKEKAVAEYQQIGALPGPFGCQYNGVNSSTELSCNYEKIRANNNGFLVVNPWQSTITARRIVWPDDVLPVLKKFETFNSRYVCFSVGGVKRTKEYLAARLFGERIGPLRDLPKDKRFIRNSINAAKSRQMGIGRDQGPLRDAAVARGEQDEALISHGAGKGTKFVEPSYHPILTVYPVVLHRHPDWEDGDSKKHNKPLFIEVITDPDWRGFAFSTTLIRHVTFGNGRWISDDMSEFSPPEYDGDVPVVFMMDGKPVCTASLGGGPGVTVYDVETGASIHIGKGGG